MLGNILYRIDKWMSSGNHILLPLLFIGTSVLMIQFTSTMIIGIPVLCVFCSWVVFVRVRILNGSLKFDKSGIYVPEVGDKYIVQKDFKYDFNKVMNDKNFIHYENIKTIKKGSVFVILRIDELKDNWEIKSKYNDDYLLFFWLDVRNYIKTPMEIRNDKLKKILK